MRKIQTVAEKDKKKKRDQLVVGGVMIGLLVLSSLGYSFMSGDGDFENSEISEFGVDFFRESGLWKFEIDGGVFGFQNLPSEVADIDVNVSADLSMYSGQPLYFVSPNEGAGEFLNNVGGYILRYQEACLVNESCDGNFPVKDCESNLVIFLSGNETGVYQDDGCVYIVGDSVKGVDAFLYDVLDVN